MRIFLLQNLMCVLYCLRFIIKYASGSCPEVEVLKRCMSRWVQMLISFPELNSYWKSFTSCWTLDMHVKKKKSWKSRDPAVWPQVESRDFWINCRAGQSNMYPVFLHFKILWNVLYVHAEFFFSVFPEWHKQYSTVVYIKHKGNNQKHINTVTLISEKHCSLLCCPLSVESGSKWLFACWRWTFRG